MARIRCRCGEVLNDFQIPSDIIIRAFPDKQFDDLLNYIGRDKPDDWPPEPQIEIWCCPVCGRMHVFKNGSLSPIVYKIEDDNSKNM